MNKIDINLGRDEIIGLIRLAADVSLEAGALAMQYHGGKQLEVKLKGDFSPVTKADKEASRIITERLSVTGRNTISEEEKIPGYEIRKHWEEVWIIDPIDGTKEFIRGSGDFTVNIAFVTGNEVIMGVVYLPYFNELYYGIKGVGAFKQITDQHKLIETNMLSPELKITPRTEGGKLTVVTSTSHYNLKTRRFVDNIQKKNPFVEIVRRGSSLKYCLVAEGKADIYPRLSTIHEWDTAAGQAIAEASGCIVVGSDGSSPLCYNKKRLTTPPNIVAASQSIMKKLL